MLSILSAGYNILIVLEFLIKIYEHKKSQKSQN